MALNARKRKALAAMLSYPTRAAASRACGISARTLQEYEQDPEYKKALEDARAENLDTALHSLQGAMPRAVSVLEAVANNPKANENARVCAARAVLEFGLRYTEAGRHERMLRDLEKEAGLDDSEF